MPLWACRELLRSFTDVIREWDAPSSFIQVKLLLGVTNTTYYTDMYIQCTNWIFLRIKSFAFNCNFSVGILWWFGNLWKYFGFSYLVTYHRLHHVVGSSPFFWSKLSVYEFKICLWTITLMKTGYNSSANVFLVSVALPMPPIDWLNGSVTISTTLQLAHFFLIRSQLLCCQPYLLMDSNVIVWHWQQKRLISHIAYRKLRNRINLISS